MTDPKIITKEASLNDAGVYKFIIDCQKFANDLSAGVPEKYEYKLVLDQDTNWTLHIYPNGVTQQERGYLSVLLSFHSTSRPEIEASISLAVQHRSGYKHQKKDVTREFKSGEEFGWTKLVSRYDLFDYEWKKKTALIHNKTLTLFFEIQLHLTRFDMNAVPKSSVYSLKPGTRQKLFTDFTIKVQGKEIKAHKVFLCEASGKLFEMLSNDPKKNVMELKDLDFEIVEKIINFIYEDKIEGIENSTRTFLIAANKFKMVRLKKYCEKIYYNNTNVQNVYDTLKFSVDHDCDELKLECIEFMGRRISGLTNMNWLDFIKNHPDLFNKFFKHCVFLNNGKITDHYEKKHLEVLRHSHIQFKERGPEQDFGYLYLDKKLSDVKLKVGDKSLNGHKAVLSSRSPHFKAIFEHDCKESRESQVVIENFDLKTMREVLKYIYCGKVNLKKAALDLLPAADYFELPELVENCEKTLMIILNVGNLSDIYEIAKTPSFPKLKERVADFFGRNILKNMESEQWPELIKENPEMIADLFEGMIAEIFKK